MHSPPPGLTAAWCKRAAAMPPLAARLLVGGAAPSEVAAPQRFFGR